MADFTDKLALGTSRMNPSSMVPGAMGGNAPQSGFSTQSAIQPGRTAMAQQQAAREQQANALMRQLMQQSRPLPEGANKFLPNDVRPMGAGQMLMEGLRNSPHISKRQDELGANTVPNEFKMNRVQSYRQSELPSETQQMLPNKNDKKGGYKKEDFQLLSDVFKTLSER